jgi:hypothetical protein
VSEIDEFEENGYVLINKKGRFIGFHEVSTHGPNRKYRRMETLNINKAQIFKIPLQSIEKKYNISIADLIPIKAMATRIVELDKNIELNFKI